MTETVSNAVATKDDGPTELIRQYRNDFALVLPSHVPPDAWVRLTTGLFRRNPKLARVAKRNPGSLLAALLDCARLGLEPGDTYHLVPFGNEIQGISDYTGLIELMYNAGAAKAIKVEVIYQRDLDIDPNDRTEDYPHGRPRFIWRPSEMDRPHHSPDWFSNRGEMVGAYAYAEMVDGSMSQVIIRNKAEIEQVKAVSKTAKEKDSPWNKWPDRMWKKTVIRELSKFVPTSAEVRKSVQASAERAEMPAQLQDISQVLSRSDDNAEIDVTDAEVIEDAPENIPAAIPPAGDPAGDPGVHHDKGHPGEHPNGPVVLVAWSPHCPLCESDQAGKEHYYAHNASAEPEPTCKYCERETAWIASGKVDA